MASEGASNEPVDCDNTEDPVLLRCSPLRQPLEGPKTGDKSNMRNKEPIYIADDKFFDVWGDCDGKPERNCEGRCLSF